MVSFFSSHFAELLLWQIDSRSKRNLHDRAKVLGRSACSRTACQSSNHRQALWLVGYQPARRARSSARTSTGRLCTNNLRLISGEQLVLRERKTAYNGAQGVPIREQIVAEHGTAIVTRNAYGALCLNVPDVLFADIDFDDLRSLPSIEDLQAMSLVASIPITVVVALVWQSLTTAILVACVLVVIAQLLRLLRVIIGDRESSIERQCIKRIEDYVESHSHWGIHVYRTPAGLRLLATHRTFDVQEPEVAEFFKSVKADRVYVRMCMNQRCFRARVTAKPWRIGIKTHITPSPGVWPISPDRMPARQKWIASYDKCALSYAACRFVKSIGNGLIHPDVQEVRRLHDELSRANSSLSLA